MTWLKKNKMMPLIVVIVGVSLGLGSLFFFYFQKEDVPLWENTQYSTASTETHSAISEQITETILVDIKGAVMRPGVYELAFDARLQELILLAGGLNELAEDRSLNLAEKLVDQQMIYVATKEEVAFTMPLPEKQIAETKEALININTASLSELQQLTGVGPAKAQAIIDHREENGLFKSVDDLTQVSGFGEKTVEKLRNSIKI